MAFTSKTIGLARAAVRAAGRAVDTAVRALTRAWAAVWDTLTGPLQRALERLLTGADTWPGRRAIATDPALQATLEGAAAALAELAELAATEAIRAADAATERADDDQGAVIGSQLPPGLATPVGPGGFHQRALETIRARVRQRIISLTRPLAPDADAAMRRELVRGVRVGANPRETAGRMVRQVEGAFNGGLARAAAIARTETLDAYRQAAAVVQEASRDVLRGWVWLAELSPTTCAACWAMHGTEHPLDEPGPLGHVNCRCSRAPLTASWRDLGFDMPEPEDTIADAQTVFDALPEAEQIQIMGRARLELYRQGRIAWRDLARRRTNPGWRDSYAPVPVRDLAPA